MPAASHRQTDADRIVLLIDLDCFYAQCECIRLGFDSTTTPLALLQWNSVLAVTYPAREMFGIKRGDGWEEVRRKSNGKCWTVHVPMLSHTNTKTKPSTSVVSNEENEELEDVDADPFPHDTLDDEYEKIFQASEADQLLSRKELGVRRFSHEGKACIERYRIASRRIFSTILEYLDSLNKVLKRKVVMERASIDELFFDVSGACFSDCIVKETDDDFQTALEATKAVCLDDPATNENNERDPAETIAFQRGVVLAWRIRKFVREKLNFTMTAGIGQNKTIAKVTASYGKPNGQAITYPSAVASLLRNTEIKKCRNFGGKLGKRVLSLLPEDAPATMGAIVQYLSLPDLEEGLGDKALARWVHQTARGFDTEAVVYREKSLIKSITAFKSLPFHNDGHTIEQAKPWIALLAQEVIKRVDQDTERNNRYPRTLSVHYAAQGWGHHKTISIRMEFPTERISSEEKIKLLMNDVPKAIVDKAGKEFKFHRIGLCADGFIMKAKNCKSISSYFAQKGKSSENGLEDTVASPSGCRASQNTDDDIEFVQGKKPYLNATMANSARTDVDRDMELARTLQLEYDREQRMLESLERREKIQATSVGLPKTKKKRLEDSLGSIKKIDSFFQKRKP